MAQRRNKPPTGPTSPAMLSLLDFHEGLHLKDTPLWFDAQEPKELCFVSSAMVPGGYRHGKVLTTATTAELMRAMGAAYGRGRRVHEPQILVTPFGRPFSLGQLRLELFPSGYVLGASSLLIEHQNKRVVYAGQLSVAPHGLAERLEARRCDLLVLPYPRGVSDSDVPTEEEVTADIVSFVEESFDCRQVPVLLCPPLAAGPQVAHALAKRGISLKLHRHLFAAFRVYARLGGLLDMSRMRRYRGQLDVVRRPEALLWPVGLHQSPALAKLSRARRAVVGARAAEPAYRADLGCCAGFVLGPRGGVEGLIEYIKASGPRQVVFVGGEPDADLRAAIAAAGVDVCHLGPTEQLSLDL
ncbi:MAG: hypothetical protein JRH20_04740 [Deltaproteobacteria bacterium]|nr:hypothetical protein [Deltaproteobacteria bacterium]